MNSEEVEWAFPELFPCTPAKNFPTNFQNEC